jgi:hypothetical protein
MKARALACSSFFAHHLPNALQFLRHLLVGRDNRIETCRQSSPQSGPRSRQPDGKVAVPHGLQAGENRAEVSRIGLGHQNGIAVTIRFFSSCSPGGWDALAHAVA